MTPEWTHEGRRVDDPALREELRRMIEDESDLVVEHRFFYGASAPYRFVASDFEKLIESRPRSEARPSTEVTAQFALSRTLARGLHPMSDRNTTVPKSCWRQTNVR